MRKKAVLFMLLLANAMLLAFSIVPHHHHDEGDICFEQTHCSCEHSNENDLDNHSHDGDECFLKYQITEPRKNSDLLNVYQHQTYPIVAFIPAALLKLACINTYTRSDKTLFIPEKVNLYSSPLCNNRGLRAPPHLS